MATNAFTDSLRKAVAALDDAVTQLELQLEAEDGPYVVDFDCGAELHVLDTTETGVELSFTEHKAHSWWFDKASLSQLIDNLLEIHNGLEDDDEEGCDCDC